MAILSILSPPHFTPPFPTLSFITFPFTDTHSREELVENVLTLQVYASERGGRVFAECSAVIETAWVKHGLVFLRRGQSLNRISLY